MNIIIFPLLFLSLIILIVVYLTTRVKRKGDVIIISFSRYNIDSYIFKVDVDSIVYMGKKRWGVNIKVFEKFTSKNIRIHRFPTETKWGAGKLKRKIEKQLEIE